MLGGLQEIGNSVQTLIVKIIVDGGEISPDGIEDALNFYFGSESNISVRVDANNPQSVLKVDGVLICKNCGTLLGFE